MHELTRLCALYHLEFECDMVAMNAFECIYPLHIRVQGIQCVSVCCKFQRCINKRNFGFCGSFDLIFSFEFHFIKLNTHAHMHPYRSDGRSMSFQLQSKECFAVLCSSTICAIQCNTVSDICRMLMVLVCDISRNSVWCLLFVC